MQYLYYPVIYIYIYVYNLVFPTGYECCEGGRAVIEFCHHHTSPLVSTTRAVSRIKECK